MPLDIKTANEQLTKENVRIKIKQRNRALFLVGTLPAKPNSTKTKPHQQEISLKAKQASPENIALAMVEARMIDQALRLGRFNWEDYSPKVYKQAHRTIGDLIEEFNENHWLKYEKTKRREQRWNQQVVYYLQKLPSNKEPSVALFKELIEQYPINSCTRKRLATYVIGLAKLADFSIKELEALNRLKGNYSVKHSKPRRILTDTELLQLRASVEPGPARFVIEALILWGLRPHEIYLIDELTPDNGGLIQIREGGKSKVARMVRPLYPEYYERWQTWKGNPPGNNRIDKGDVITDLFRTLNLGLRPYDLRHSWAVRAMYYPKITEEQAARSMGHSLVVHQRIYEYWLTQHREKEEFLLSQNRAGTFELLPDAPEPSSYKSKRFYGEPGPLSKRFNKPNCPKCKSPKTVWSGFARYKEETYGRRIVCRTCGTYTTVRETKGLEDQND